MTRRPTKRQIARAISAQAPSIMKQEIKPVTTQNANRRQSGGNGSHKPEGEHLAVFSGTHKSLHELYGA